MDTTIARPRPAHQNEPFRRCHNITTLLRKVLMPGVESGPDEVNGVGAACEKPSESPDAGSAIRGHRNTRSSALSCCFLGEFARSSIPCAGPWFATPSGCCLQRAQRLERSILPRRLRARHETGIEPRCGIRHPSIMGTDEDTVSASHWRPGEIVIIGLSTDGRGGEIRTPDPLFPKQMRYQAALRPDDQRSSDLFLKRKGLSRKARQQFRGRSLDASWCRRPRSR